MSKEQPSPSDENEISQRVDETLSEIGSQRETLSSSGISVEAIAKNTKPIVAAFLALGLWTMLALAMVWNGACVTWLSAKLVNLDYKDKEISEQKERVINATLSNINDTAKTLYAILAPLATAVSAYYYEERRR